MQLPDLPFEDPPFASHCLGKYGVFPHFRCDAPYIWLHDTEKSAREEAYKLAKEHRESVIVAKVVGMYETIPRYSSTGGK